jgi:hypothetical protein
MDQARSQIDQEENSYKSLPELVSIEPSNKYDGNEEGQTEKLKKQVDIAKQTIKDYIDSCDMKNIIMCILAILLMFCLVIFGFKSSSSSSSSSSTSSKSAGGGNGISNMSQRFKSI